MKKETVKKANIIRRILLQILIGSWFYPSIWTFIFLIAFLALGIEDAIEVCIWLTKTTWYGKVD